MPLGKILKNEDGGITPFGLYFGVATMMIGGLAVDGRHQIGILRD